MYPQPSCSVSNMALVPLRKKREIEQINTDHQIPPISFTSPPTWIKAQGGCGWGLHTYINTYVCAHMVSLFRCCVYMHVLPLKKKKIILRGMLGGWCLRNTSLLCTVHTLSFKHSDHCVRVHRPTSPLYHRPSLAPVRRVTCFFFGGPVCLRFLSVAGSLWEALWPSAVTPVTCTSVRQKK